MTTERITIKWSETAEILLKRIVESRLGSGSGTGLYLMCDCMIEHLIWEEARRRKLTDCSQSEDRSHPQGGVLEDQDIEKEMIE